MLSIRSSSQNQIHEEKKDLERLTKIKPYTDKQNWKLINYPTERNDWKKFEKNDLTNPLRKYIVPVFQNKM